MVTTDYTDATTIDVDEVIANIRNSYARRRQHWTDAASWPNVTVAALAFEVLRLRQVETDLLVSIGRSAFNAGRAAAGGTP